MSKSYAYRGLALFTFIAGSAVITEGARAESYIIDPKHTEVRFVYTMALATQRGRFTAVRGAMEFDEKAPQKTRVNAIIKTASLSTGEAMTESTLKGSQFFNAERQPEIRFQSDAVKMTAADKAQMTGKITVNGITKPITFDVSIVSGDDPKMKYRVGSRRFTAIGQIRRSAFNMTAYSSMVDDDVAIEIDALMKKQEQKAAAN